MLTNVESSRTMATGLSSGRILVVDDDPAVRHLISDYFGEHGMKAPRVIRTERGVGYVFAIPVEQSRWANWP